MGSACSSGPKVASAPSASPMARHGVAESKDLQGGALTARAVNPQIVQVAPRPSALKSNRNSMEDFAIEVGNGPDNCRRSIEMSGRSIARLNTLDMDRGTPQQCLEELINGNLRFISGQSNHPHQDFFRLQKIAPKQKPIAAVLACADSRVPVELLLDQGFGDVFVCRIAGNIATSEEIASLEYAVLDLGVKVIMVMGHTSCGAVKAALSGKAFPGFITALVDQLDVAIWRTRHNGLASDDQLEECKCGHPDPTVLDNVIRQNVVHQIDRCKRSTLILDAMNKGKVLLVPSVYDIKTGQVVILNE